MDNLLLFSRSVASECFITTWTEAHRDPLIMGFSRQEHQSGMPFPSSGDLPSPGMKPASPALAGGFCTTEPPGKTPWRMHSTCHIADAQEMAPKSHAGPASQTCSSCPPVARCQALFYNPLHLRHSPTWAVVSTLLFYRRGSGQGEAKSRGQQEAPLVGSQEVWCSSQAPDLSCPRRTPALVQESPLPCPALGPRPGLGGAGAPRAPPTRALPSRNGAFRRSWLPER